MNLISLEAFYNQSDPCDVFFLALDVSFVLFLFSLTCVVACRSALLCHAESLCRACLSSLAMPRFMWRALGPDSRSNCRVSKDPMPYSDAFCAVPQSCPHARLNPFFFLTWPESLTLPESGCFLQKQNYLVKSVVHFDDMVPGTRLQPQVGRGGAREA